MSSRRRLRDELLAAAKTAEPVWVKRSIDRARLFGCVVGVGERWALLHYLEGAVFLNGYVAVRLKHVRKVKRLGDDPVTAEGLRHFGETPSPAEGIDLSGTRRLLMSAAAHHPLVTIHLEQSAPEVCYIGVPETATRKRVRLREIDPSGRWLPESSRWRLSDITRVDFGGRYETALALVASPASQLPSEQPPLELGWHPSAGPSR